MANIVILTGAGISAESGLGTFRDKDGLWTRVRIEDVATPEGFARDPAMVHDFYNLRRVKAARAAPNAAHVALARLECDWAGDVTIVTQNVDALHEKAGSTAVLHMHGELAGALCAACGHRWRAPDSMRPGEPCPACGGPAGRPDVVWFGEMPYHLHRIDRLLGAADVFAAIGTSGQVYPAADFVHQARASGAHTVEINLEPSNLSHAFDDLRTGPASRTVPDWVDGLLSG